MSYATLPSDEIEVFKKLPNLKVIFDVGSRDDLEYLEIYPNAEYHLFEPNPIFFHNLEENLKQRKFERVYLNNFGLGDFDMEYIGGRNVLCMNKNLVSVETRNELRLFLAKHKAKHGYTS